MLEPTSYKAKLFIDLLHKYSIEIYDITPNDINRNRKIEIVEYLNNHDIESFIIIDDEDCNLKETFKDNFYKVNSFYNGNQKQTDNETGLKIEHINEIVKLLNNQKVKKLSYKK